MGAVARGTTGGFFQIDDENTGTAAIESKHCCLPISYSECCGNISLTNV